MARQTQTPDPLKRRERIALLILLSILELWLFTGAFHKYFTRDSLFYMTNIAHSWAELKSFVLAPSQEMSYRPVNVAMVTLLSPILGKDPQPWHWVPVVFHIANTFLFYLVARKILPGSIAALGAAGFWGLHSVAGWVTYDITYFSDFLLAFLLLATILLAIEGRRRRSGWFIAGALACFTLSLMTKEAATTFPLGIWIALVLADLRSSGEPVTRRRVALAIRSSLPVMSAFIVIDIAFASLYIFWLLSGRIYAQHTSSAYRIHPFANLAGKVKYLFWSFNLPDALHIPEAARYRALAFASSVAVLAMWALDLLRRRCRLSWVEGAGILWFAGMNIPSLMLSQRLAKWYLYIPLFGLALAFGVLVRNLSVLTRWEGRRAAMPLILLGAIAFSSAVQTRSYVTRSDAVYESDLLASYVADFRRDHASLAPEVTLFFLPAFEEGISEFLASDPIGHGELIRMYYPGTRVKALHAFRGDRMPHNSESRQNVIILQHLDGRLHDVTRYFPSDGRMILHLLPTPEGEIAPLFKKRPAGGSELYREFVRIDCADLGAALPEDYLSRKDIWVLQYIDGHFDDVTRYYINDRENTTLILPTINGRPPRLMLLEENPATAALLRKSHVRLLVNGSAQIPSGYESRTDLFFVQFLGGKFTDVTGYYRGRHAANALRIARSLDGVKFFVDRAEFYPKYDRFDTITGAPVFFPTPEKEILTQIAGSTAILPIPAAPRNSRLRFDVSWMHSHGDGGWAEALIRSGGKEIVVFREYFNPDPTAKSLEWKEVSFDIPETVVLGAELLLRCYNDRGKNTVADWLNWRDIAIETRN